jgi:NAD(P)-dependent dehydrogenase (short-subunit alcohol dehydrogenase family)
MQSMTGRTCLVTGATSGIGEETALGLARRGARVLVVGRDPERGERARASIAERSGNSAIELLLADFSRLSEVRRLAVEVGQRTAELHVLVNNAGVVNLSRTTTPDGFESTFAVNHLAYFLLTQLLLPLLQRSAPARIVNVASDAHKFGPLDLDDLQSERRYRSMRVYGASKTANLLFTQELAKRLEGTPVTVNALHPGAVATRLGHNNGWLGKLATSLTKPFFLTPAQGAETSVFLASDPSVARVNGRYFVKKRAIEPAPHARDPLAAKRLWDESARMVDLA